MNLEAWKLIGFFAFVFGAAYLISHLIERK